MFNDEDPPFLRPFLFAMAFGLPVSGLWYAMAIHGGMVSTVVTILLGCACGMGARVGSRGWACTAPAIIATLTLIVFTLPFITLRFLSIEAREPMWKLAARIVLDMDLIGFANACVLLSGKIFYGYAFGLAAAWKVTDE